VDGAQENTLDTTAAGGAMSDPVGTTSVLVRLYECNFQFGTARDDGSDIRFGRRR